MTSVAVIGLGKLGSCLAASLANGGFTVHGVDINPERVRKINAGEVPFPEPQLDEYVDGAGSRLRATTDADEAVRRSRATFVFVNTPADRDGQHSLDQVRRAVETIGDTLATVDDYHLVVIRSTVMPGATTGPIREWIESTSGKTAGEDFGLAYCPEFTAVGEVIEGIERPDFFLVGEHDSRAGDELESLYRDWVDEPSPVIRTDPTSAEIGKMAINSYVTMKISFANSLAEISDGVGGLVDEVSEILAADSRINGNYLTAGASFGGPCFSRDNEAFSALATRAGTRVPLAKATDEVNEIHTDWIAGHVRDVTPADGVVGILGLTYKPGVRVVDDSQGVRLVEALAGEFDLACYDPMGISAARERIDVPVDFHEEFRSAVSSVDSVVLTVPWDEFTDPQPYRDGGVAVVDPWRLFETDDFEGSNQYRPVGSSFVAGSGDAVIAPHDRLDGTESR